MCEVSGQILGMSNKYIKSRCNNSSEKVPVSVKSTLKYRHLGKTVNHTETV